MFDAGLQTLMYMFGVPVESCAPSDLTDALSECQIELLLGLRVSGWEL